MAFNLPLQPGVGQGMPVGGPTPLPPAGPIGGFRGGPFVGGPTPAGGPTPLPPAGPAGLSKRDARIEQMRRRRMASMGQLPPAEGPAPHQKRAMLQGQREALGGGNVSWGSAY